MAGQMTRAKRQTYTPNPGRVDEITRFLREKCGVSGKAPFRADPKRVVLAETVFRAWAEWCAANGVARVVERSQLGRDIRLVMPGVRSARLFSPISSSGERKRQLFLIGFHLTSS